MHSSNSTIPTDDALRRFERHQDSLPDETAADTERIESGIADYFLTQIFLSNHRLNKFEADYLNRFIEIAMDNVNEDNLGEFLKECKTDSCEGGVKGSKFADKCAKQVAKEFREELEPLAIEYGYVLAA
ncbi:hypothetical protein P3339_07990 [Microbulbifer sp. MLAF003]|uniref:hypothetical protein n=1 Tax=Microbulbifer sp. MLAF003 TaxID=3032582 RepID=UPI0024AD4356|nr:hypothetical protein [Microbulbifer sp. MLAF003]WHI52688.1 hypothetical protein P3339_07990 [Microbulbifer sp. MLAF003]